MTRRGQDLTRLSAQEGHAETGRHNKVQEGIGYGNLDVARKRLGVDRENNAMLAQGTPQEITVNGKQVLILRRSQAELCAATTASNVPVFDQPTKSEFPCNLLAPRATLFGFSSSQRFDRKRCHFHTFSVP